MIRILTSLVAVLTVTSIQSQTTLRETPKLVIGITIDQLRSDYLDLFHHTFGEKGFKRLLSQGLVYHNISFDFPNLNETSSIATIYTGALPFYHGIVGSQLYIADKNAQTPIFEDNTFAGKHTKEKLSPMALSVTTITDELKIASQGKSDIFSFAPHAAQAIASAGRLANGAYWIDDYNGKWATTNYYKDLYWIVEQENKSNIYSNKANTIIWSPALGSEKYNLFPYSTSKSAFSHKFDQPTNSYIRLKESPFVNENITKTAIKLMQKDDMGARTSPDFLALTYYAGNYADASADDYSLEIQDTYARLDQEIAALLEQVEKTVGLQNTLIFVTSTGYYNSSSQYPAHASTTQKAFYTKRCEALLNMYLMTIYGKGKWVDKYHDQQIYLNRKLIESKNIDLESIQNKAVEFVIQFSGVQDATTSIQLLTGKANANMVAYRNMLAKGYSGDLIIEVQSGYTIVLEEGTTDKTKSKTHRELAIISPAIFFGHGIKPEKIKRTVRATQIAPSVCRILRIRSPNAAKDQPLPELF
ncbi:MAG: hypothetical protein RL662_1512 [Bacteroidota bacterium]|jgi:arylsulfatase A-like enzyme